MAQTILEEKKKSRLMTEGSIWKSILLFSVPLILGNMLQQLYNTADSIIVGNFVGSNALAAVGSSGSPIFLLIGFSQGIAVGAGVVVSQFLGAKDREGAHTAVHTSLALSAILGAILTVCGVAVSRALLTAMNTPAEVLEDAVLYMRLYFGGVLFSVVYNMAAGILNAAGNSKRSLLYLGVASITNIVLDLVLIAGCKMGVAGAAIATDISQLVSCVLSLRFLMRVEDDYRVTAKEVRVHKKMAVRIIKVGLPTGIQNMVISLSNVLVQVSVNGYGAAAMAGFAAYMKVDGFNILPVLSFSMAATTFVGQNFGAGKIDRVKKGTFVTLGMCIVYTILTGILLLAYMDEPRQRQLWEYWHGVDNILNLNEFNLFQARCREIAAAGMTFYHGEGCPKCNGIGYRGRMGIFEIFIVNEELQQMIYEVSTLVELRTKARELGMRIMREDGVRKVASGLTTADEVLKVTMNES